MADMDSAALALCQNIENARLAFVQSDEISVLLTDFATPQSEAWFDGNLQKICSLSAAIATAYFNNARSVRSGSGASVALFDSRVWTIPQHVEVYNYFLWRQQDASRNSLSMTAQAHFPHERLQGLGSAERHELLWQEKQINWNDLPAGFKRGRVIERVIVSKSVDYVDKRSGEQKRQENVTRHQWRVTDPPVFSQDKEWLRSRIQEAE
jgi:tRNA(His) 5'-end guanylyltransferase